MRTNQQTDPFTLKNIRLFIAFRVCFNARFYYPVFTILFLDFGLTLEQFALLNVVWAASIVLFEIPSGALADTLGRKNLLVVAALCMVIEMALFCFAPSHSPQLLFICLMANRVFSGIAEAAASGADEALAYDSLNQHDQVKAWGNILEKQMRYRSMAFVAAMTIGALVYDPEVVRKLTVLMGLKINVDQSLTLRFPLYLTFAMSFLVLFITLKMEDTSEQKRSAECEDSTAAACGNNIYAAFKVTFAAGRWILKTPFAFVLIMVAVYFDHIIRMVITLTSQYFRVIEIPEAVFGFIGSGLALIGVFIPRLALYVSQTKTPRYNMTILVILIFAGLAGMVPCFPLLLGLLPVILLYIAISMNNFLLSHYLNQITESAQRATVLSFKGLSLNLAYGGIGLLYSLLVYQIKAIKGHEMQMSTKGLENAVFIASLGWFPVYFLIGLGVLLLISAIKLKGIESHKRIN